MQREYFHELLAPVEDYEDEHEEGAEAHTAQPSLALCLRCDHLWPHTVGTMKTLLALLFAFSYLGLQAQVVPTTPTKFQTRGLGTSTSSNGLSSASAAASVAKPEPTFRTITYLTLSGQRQWTSTDGKPLLAKLIAFEDIVVETKGAAQPAPAAAPTLPNKPTVVSNGKVRLFFNNKPYELALDRLSQADRDFIATVERAVVAKPVAAPAMVPATK